MVFDDSCKDTPIAACILLTRNSNLVCRHCIFSCPSPSKIDIPTELLISLIQDLSENNIKVLDFSGGEPLIRKDFSKIILNTLSLPFDEVSVASNLCLLGLDLVSEISEIENKYKKKIRWRVSLDGANEISHNYLRGENAFQALMTSINLLRKFDNTPSEINSIVYQGNVDELDNMGKIVENTGASIWAWFPILPFGRGIKMQNQQLSVNYWSILLPIIRKQLEIKYRIHIRIHGPILEENTSVLLRSPTPIDFSRSLRLIGIDYDCKIYQLGCLKAMKQGKSLWQYPNDSIDKIWSELKLYSFECAKNCLTCEWESYCNENSPSENTFELSDDDLIKYKIWHNGIINAKLGKS